MHPPRPRTRRFHPLLLLAIALGPTACVSGGADAKAEASVPAAQHFRVVGGRLEVPAAVAFGAGSAELLPASDDCLRHVQAFLQARQDVTLLRIEVHGAAPVLTEQRALLVGQRLVELGVEPARLLPVGFGTSKPVADASTPDGRAHNQRVEFRPAALRGLPISGLPVDGGGVVAGPLRR